MGSVSGDEDADRPVLRIAGPNDAVALMKLKQRLDEQTSLMLLEPAERDTSIQALARHREEVSQSENSVVIVADRHGDLAGYVELAGGKAAACYPGGHIGHACCRYTSVAVRRLGPRCANRPDHARAWRRRVLG